MTNLKIKSDLYSLSKNDLNSLPIFTFENKLLKTRVLQINDNFLSVASQFILGDQSFISKYNLFLSFNRQLMIGLVNIFDYLEYKLVVKIPDASFPDATSDNEIFVIVNNEEKSFDMYGNNKDEAITKDNIKQILKELNIDFNMDLLSDSFEIINEKVNLKVPTTFNQVPTTFNQVPTTFNQVLTTFNQVPTTFNQVPTTSNQFQTSSSNQFQTSSFNQLPASSFNQLPASFQPPEDEDEDEDEDEEGEDVIVSDAENSDNGSDEDTGEWDDEQ